jgi:hypothetical protein
MVLIFGWGAGKAQDLGEVAPTTCPNCHNQVFLHHIKSDKKISLYFIPVVPYGSDEYLACPICKAGIQLQPSQRDAVTRMKGLTSAFRSQTLSQAAYQPAVDQFWRAMGVNPSGQQVLQPTATIPPPAAAPVPAAASPTPPEAPSVADRLADLGKLHATGVLTDEEFSAAKRRLLGL